MYHITSLANRLISTQVFLLLLFVIQTFNTCWASNFEKEKYWKIMISENLKIGEPVQLKAGEKSFFAIYTKQNRLNQRGSVILLHGKAAHPDWKEVIRPLRTKLVDYGWNTLSIQMPIRTKSLTSKEEIEKFNKDGALRLDSTLVYLKAKKTPSIFLLTHGENAETALAYMKDNPKRIIHGLILVSMPIKKHLNKKSIEMLEQLKIPVLDIYASRDIETVRFTAKERQSAANRGGNSNYRQQQINNADYSYDKQIKTLIKRIHSWMLAMVQR